MVRVRCQSTPFAHLDRDLACFRDYRGFSALFSGNRSIHFHFRYVARGTPVMFKSGKVYQNRASRQFA